MKDFSGKFLITGAKPRGRGIAKTFKEAEIDTSNRRKPVSRRDTRKMTGCVVSLFRMKITENVKFRKRIKVRSLPIPAKTLGITSKKQSGIRIA